MKEMRQVWMTEDGWIAERADECTCSPYYGHHEPTCGWEPIGKLNDEAAPLQAFAADLAGRPIGKLNDAAPLRAAAGALCDESGELPDVPMFTANDIRDVLTDDGAAALREVKAQTYREGVKAGRAHERTIQSLLPDDDPDSIPDPGTPYDRDTADREAGDA